MCPLFSAQLKEEMWSSFGHSFWHMLLFDEYTGWGCHCSTNAGHMDTGLLVGDDILCPHNDTDLKLWGKILASKGRMRLILPL